jgi:hypothetical protein
MIFSAQLMEQKSNLALDNMMEGTIFKTHSKHALSMRDKNINYILRYKCI